MKLGALSLLIGIRQNIYFKSQVVKIIVLQLKNLMVIQIKFYLDRR